MENELRHKDVWSGEYKGVGFEICRWSYKDTIGLGGDSERNVWNSYIYLPIDAFDESLHDILWQKPHFTKYGTLLYSYNDDFFNAIDFHGGITYYDKVMGLDGGRKVIKIGCDYNHAWDQDMYFTQDGVCVDIKRSVDSLLAANPNMKKRCIWSGEYYDKAEGYEMRDGSFHSFDSIKSRTADTKPKTKGENDGK